MVKNHKLVNMLLIFSLIFTFLFAMSFFYVNIFFISPFNYKVSVNNFLLWFVALPSNAIYLNYGVCFFYFLLFVKKLVFLLGLFGAPAFVIIASQMINIRQKELLNQLTQLHDHLQTNNQKLKFKSQKFSLWRIFLSVNRSLIKLSSDTDKCSSYFSAPLSAYFVGFITIQCYVAYIVFFAPSSYLLVKLFFFYCLLMVESSQFMLVKTLSKLTTCNNKLEKANAKFYLLFNKKGGFKSREMMTRILKVIKTFVKFFN